MYSIIERKVPDLRVALFEENLIAKNATVLFQVGNCVFVETFSSSCRYVYEVICLTGPGRKKWRERKTQIHTMQYDAVAEKIFMLPFYKENVLPSIEERGNKLIGLIFADVLPKHGFVYRTSQEHLAKTIYTAMLGKKIALCEAGTGSGKTLAYLVAAVVYELFLPGSPTTIISTSTIALQKAITEDYLPKLSEILAGHRVIEKPLTYVVRKGKTHYACDMRLQDYLSSVANLGKEAELIEQLQAITAAPVSETDLSLYPLSRYVKDCICVDGRCSPSCPKNQICRYHRFIDGCLNDAYSFQITNHNFALAHFQQMRKNGHALFPHFHMLVLDEAHKLLDAARQIYGTEYAKSEIADLIRNLPLTHIHSHSHLKLVKGWLDMLLERNEHLFNVVVHADAPKHSGENIKKTATLTRAAMHEMNKLIDGLGHLSVIIGYHCDRHFLRQLPAIRMRCKDIADRLEYFTQSTQLISWIEQNGKQISLCAIPDNIDELIYSDVWNSGIPSVMTSGTMSVQGDYSLIKQSVGIARVPVLKIVETNMPSPFEYEKNTILYIPPRLPFPDNTNRVYVAAIAKEVLRLIEVSHGHTMLLFTSYWLAERIYNLTQKDIARRYPVFIMKRGRVDTLALFRDSGNGVLFASDAAGEGVDLPGDILSSLVIVRLPFAVPDPISEHERSQCASLREYQNKIIVPAMLIKLRQYVGRAIRTEGDTAAISILDSRVGPKGKYRQIVLDSLFRTTVTDDIHDIKGFFRKRKDPSFFG